MRMAADIPRSASALIAGREAWRAGRYTDALSHFQAAAAGGAAGGIGANARALVSLGRRDEALSLLEAHRATDAEADFLLTIYRFEEHTLEEMRDRISDLRARWGVNSWFALARRLIDVLSGESPAAAAEPAVDIMESGARWLRANAGHRLGFGTAAALLNHAVDSAPDRGLYLEFGVFYGRSIRQIAARCPAEVHGFDSFQGLPEAWNPRHGAGAYSTEGELPSVPDNVQLHEGWFADTVPPFLGSRQEPVAFAHIDCDLYSSTRVVLNAMAPRLQPGAILLFDDFLGYRDYELHEFRAFLEAAETFDWQWRIAGFAFMGREVAIRIETLA